MQTIVETLSFIRQAKKLGLSNEELDSVKTLIAQHPTLGSVISGTGGARKVRIPMQGKGKSGGYRVVTYYSGEDIPVFLLDIYAKSSKANLTKAETNDLRIILASIARLYRERPQ